MTAILEKTDQKVLKVSVQGLLSKAEIDTVQASFLEHHSQDQTDRILVTLDGFEGWQEGADWGDLSFLWEHGDKIVKMAIVGDPKWEDQALIFTGAGYRFTEISFFPVEQMSQAIEWLQ